MSFKPDHKPDMDEVKYFGELGWLATMSVAIVAVSPYLLQLIH